jgi:hypothetical protein
MTTRPQQFLEVVPLEAHCPDGASDSDVHEYRWLETPAGFDGIDSFHEGGRGIAPTVIAPGEDGRRLHSILFADV